MVTMYKLQKVAKYKREERILKLQYFSWHIYFVE